MPGSLRYYRTLLRQYGVGPCAFRVGYVLRRKFGCMLRAFPTWRWEDRPLSTWMAEPGAAGPRELLRARVGAFFFEPGRPPKLPTDWAADAIAQADRLREGWFRYFSNADGQLGYPDPDWFLNPFTGQRDSAEKHWSQRGDFDPDRGDIKFIWEPSRFAWAYSLVRAYAATGDETHVETFWTLVQSWRDTNPPNMGPGWQCGQEMSIRAMAILFAMMAFLDAAPTTDERLEMGLSLLAALADRVHRNIGLARSQRSNHSATEATWIWTAGTILPFLAGADAWRRRGRRILEHDARRYYWSDGSYMMHSVNYQRMTLQCYLWAIRLDDRNGRTLSDRLRDRTRRQAEFLYQLQDPTGRLPNYGSNDGALLLPWSDCDYLDYRPTIGAAWSLLKDRIPYGDGPWREETLWLLGRDAADRSEEARLPRVSKASDVGGYYTLRGGDSWALVRCHAFRNRPGQGDLLHVDLWWRGCNVLRDTGTFQYYDPQGQWAKYFPSTAAHNTIVVDDAEQMLKGPRFSWETLADARVLAFEPDAARFEGEHYGYTRLASGAVHRRALARLRDDCWLVVDDVLGTGNATSCLRWHVPDLQTDDGGDGSLMVRTDTGPARLWCLSAATLEYDFAHGRDEPGRRAGWESLYYGRRTPIHTWTIRATSFLPIRLVTVVVLGESADIPQLAGDELRMGDRPVVTMFPSGADRILRCPPGPVLADGRQ